MTATRFDESKYEVKAEELNAKEYQREKSIPYHFKAGHDYMTDVEFDQPAYVLPQFRTHDARPGASFYEDHEGSTHEVRVGPADVRVMDRIRYVRAVEPNGNIGKIHTSTCPPSIDPSARAKKDGNDGLGTESRVKDEKQKRGWLILEAGTMMNGRSGQDYLAWALAVAEKRRIATALMGEIAELAMESKKEKRQREEAANPSPPMPADFIQQIVAGVIAAQAALKEAEEPKRRKPASEPGQ